MSSVYNFHKSLQLCHDNEGFLDFGKASVDVCKQVEEKES